LVSALEGKVLSDRYELISEIGRGGMGVIYKARDLQAPEGERDSVAIKVLLDDAASNEVVRQRFSAEARAAERLNHPNIVKVRNYDLSKEGLPFIVMELLDGQTLHELLVEGQIDVEEALKLAIQACDALAHAHRHKVVHRDVKPANIFVIREESGFKPILVDFGIAKVFSQTGKASMRLTKTGEVFGSPQYMSPEQCMGQKIDFRSDIYSMGCVLYECVVGHSPFIADNVLALIFKHVNETPARFARTRPEKLLESVILKAMEKNPEKRFDSMTELRRSLEEILAVYRAYELGESLDDEERLSDDTEYSDASQFEFYLQRAEAGDSSAQLELSLFYRQGLFVEEDFEKSLDWCLKSAAQGNVNAMADLGDLFFEGKFLERDYDKAYYWYIKAAHLEHPGANRMVAHLLNFGIGITQNRAEALEWYQRAATLEDIDAQVLLGRAYLEGDSDLDVDVEKALDWLERAASQGDSEAQFELGMVYQDEQLGIEVDLETSLGFFRLAAEQGHAAAQRCVAVFYENGECVERDLLESRRLMLDAAERGDAEAMYWMARWHEEGSHGLLRDADLILEYLRSSAELGYAYAQYDLACRYLTGLNVARNYVQASRWLEEASNAGITDATFELAMLYKQGLGVRRNEKRYMKIIHDLSNDGFARAQNELGLSFEAANELKKARYWFEKAALQGDKDAQNNLSRLDRKPICVLRGECKISWLAGGGAG
jgi:TPR repeat protein